MDSGNLSYHAARILVLVDAFSQSPKEKLDGLTKLAKLDFLLRYPVFLERLLAARGVRWPLGAEPTPSERFSVESRMVRYKFGPWDDKYYPIIGLLIGKKLVRPLKGRGKLALRSTTSGKKIVKQLVRSGWKTQRVRSSLLHEHFNSTGTDLKRLIYREFAAELDLPWKAEIR